jgi:hypothetical protein
MWECGRSLGEQEENNRSAGRMYMSAGGSAGGVWECRRRSIVVQEECT